MVGCLHSAQKSLDDLMMSTFVCDIVYTFLSNVTISTLINCRVTLIYLVGLVIAKTNLKSRIEIDQANLKSMTI